MIAFKQRHSCEANKNVTPKNKNAYRAWIGIMYNEIGDSSGFVVVYCWVSQKAANVISSYTFHRT